MVGGGGSSVTDPKFIAFHADHDVCGWTRKH